MCRSATASLVARMVNTNLEAQDPIPEAIGSDTILWSWSADRIPQTPITIGSSDRENTKPNSLLPIESWLKSFTGKFVIE